MYHACPDRRHEDQPQVATRRLDDAVRYRHIQRHTLRARRLRDTIHGLRQGQLRCAVLLRYIWGRQRSSARVGGKSPVCLPRPDRAGGGGVARSRFWSVYRVLLMNTSQVHAGWNVVVLPRLPGRRL